MKVKNTKIKVSVILPVYNVDLYLYESMDSIINQTLKEIEIICVDDGSTDKSLSILHEYAKKDNRIIIVEQENQGAGVARNTGLSISKGEYLSFLDPDDFFELTMLEELYSKAIETNSDIVICGFKMYDDQKNQFGNNYGTIDKKIYPQKVSFSHKDILDDFYLCISNHPSWDKFYKSDFINFNKIEFQKLYRSNDTYFSFISLALANKISIIESTLVYYRINMQNSSVETRHLYPLNFYTAWIKTMEKLKKENLYNNLSQGFKINFLKSIYTNLNSQKTYKSFKTVYNQIKTYAQDDFNLIFNENLLYSNYSNYIIECYENYKLIVENSLEDYIALKEKWFIDETDNSIKISVVIYVYNMEIYLHECLNSVINQKLNEIEIICINDGSNDSSINILREYAKKDRRIIILNQETKGQYVAKNKAISIANGEYIFFINGEDIIVDYALERMFQEVVINNLDVLYFDGKPIFEIVEIENKFSNCKTIYQNKFSCNIILSGAKMFTKMQNSNCFRDQCSLCLIKIKLLKQENIIFQNDIIQSDTLFMFKTILIANRVKHIKEDLLIKRIHSGSKNIKRATFDYCYSSLICYIEMLDYMNLFEYTEDVKFSILSLLNSIFNSLKTEFVKLSENDKNEFKNTKKLTNNIFVLLEYEKLNPCLDDNIESLNKIGLGYLIPISITYFCEEYDIKLLMISIISLLENANSSTKYLIYIIHKESYSKENIENLKKLQNKYQNFKIKHILIDTEYVDDYIETSKIISSNLKQLKKCIYLKSNVVVQRDLREFYEIDLNNFNLGAVKELNINYVDEDNYNSSVLLINIEKFLFEGNTYSILPIDLKFNLRADHLSEEKTFNFASKIKLNPNLKTIYENKIIKSALTDNVIFNYSNNILPINNSECSFYNEWWKYFRLSPLNKVSKKICNNPKISVIVPVYNVGIYLSECLDSLINQTLEEIEIICINDGSTDSSLEILHDYAKFDERIIILEQENQGAGCARNKGLDIAKGEYLSFLDPDDFFELTMLEQVYNKAIENDVDIVVYDYFIYNDNTKVISTVELGSPTENEVFSYKDIEENIFIRLHHNAWTKLYKTQFVRENNIRFQNLYRINDIFFTHTASIIAKKISYLEKKLVYYRLGTKESSQSTLDMYPLSFYEAELAIKDRLNNLGYYKDVEKWFLNSLLDTMLFNLNKVIKTQVGEETYNYIKENLDNDFCINKHEKDYFIRQSFDNFMLISNLTFEKYIKSYGN